jgi:hypothetical protein
MISEQATFQQPTQVVAIRTSGAPIGRHQFVALGAVLRRSAHKLGRWARVPALPYAALWEASLVAGMVREPKDFEPDPFASETPFLSNSWPLG